MVNAQTWLNQQFPTKESKLKIKILEFNANRKRESYDNNSTATDYYYFLPEADLAGELELKDFVNLEIFSFIYSSKLTVLKIINCPKIKSLNCHQSAGLQKVTGLEQLTQLVYCSFMGCSQLQTPYTFLDNWKNELTELKNNSLKLNEHDKEALVNAALITSGFNWNNLPNNWSEIRASLGSGSLGPEIRKLAYCVYYRINEMENKIKEVNNLNQQKTNLATNLNSLQTEKDKFAKSADYLRETLKGIEKDLESTKQQLTQSQETIKKNQESYQLTLTNKEEIIKKKAESFKVISERNTDLQAKLTNSQTEITKLSEWISKLESVSADSDAFTNLKKELESAQAHNASLTEQLQAKSPKSYWWVYVLVALAGIYLVVK